MVRRRAEGAREDPVARARARAGSRERAAALVRDLHGRRALGRRARALRPLDRRGEGQVRARAPPARSSAAREGCREPAGEGDRVLPAAAAARPRRQPGQPEPGTLARAPRARAGSDPPVGGPARGPAEEGAREEPRTDHPGLARQPERSASSARRGQAAAQRGGGRQGADRAARADLCGVVCDQGRARRRARSPALALRRPAAPARGHPRPREDHRDRPGALARPARRSRPAPRRARRRAGRDGPLRGAARDRARVAGHRGEAAHARRARRRARSLRRGPRERGAHGAEHRPDPQGRAARRVRPDPARADVGYRRRDRASHRSVRGERRGRDRAAVGRTPVGRAVRADRSAEGAARRARAPGSPRGERCRARVDPVGGREARRVDSDPSDLSALDARIGILDNQQRWDDLVVALESRAAKVSSPNQRRADLVRVALVHQQQRHELDKAIDAWKRVVADHKDDEEGISALADLLAETGRWKEMADLLEGASGRATQRTVGRLVRLGDALREHLDEPTRALAAYRNAIAIDPASKPSRAGLTALLDVASTRAQAADALAQAMRTTNAVAGVLDLLPARLAEAKDDKTRLALLREAAQLRLEHKHDATGALADLARAFPLAPRDQLIENQLATHTRSVNDYTTLGIAYLEAIAALGDDAREAARLRLAYADLAADRLNDPPQAADAYRQVAEIEPGNRRPVQAYASLGSRLGQWSEVAAAIERYAGVREAFDDALHAILEANAGMAHANKQHTKTHTTALDKHKLPGAVAALFHHRLAALHRDHRKDKQAAIASLRRALELGGQRF